jgi:hypothetical protein
MAIRITVKLEPWALLRFGPGREVNRRPVEKSGAERWTTRSFAKNANEWDTRLILEIHEELRHLSKKYAASGSHRSSKSVLRDA